MPKQAKPVLVTAPEPFQPLFAAAEEAMGRFFHDVVRAPEKGRITISDVRYLLVRAASMSIQFRNELAAIYGLRTANQMIYNFGRACGLQDAAMFAEKLNLSDPATKLAAGPVHFAHVGWANVNVLPESHPSPDEGYLLVYTHPSSFESDSYTEAGIKSQDPVCFMNAGYSSGWCQVSFGVELAARELSRRAKGDKDCLFLMCHPHKMLQYTQEIKAKYSV